MKRSLIRRHIAAAWGTTVRDQYQNRRINSERGLQVHFCAALLDRFREDGVARHLFVEPCVLVGTGSEARFPDLVVCNRRSVIAVLELKYVPRGRPEVEKDLATLRHLAGGDLHVGSDRYLGDAPKGRTYPVADDAVMVWGGVYRGPRLTLAESSGIEPGRFLQLDALTAAGAPPEVHPSPGGSVTQSGAR